MNNIIYGNDKIHKEELMDIEKIIFGKNKLTNIVSVEIEDNFATIFLEDEKGISTQVVENKFWMLSPKNLNQSFNRLKGDQYYKYLVHYDTRTDFLKHRAYSKKYDFYSIYDPKTAFLTFYGYTYFKGLQLSDVSVLSFDIETSGLIKDSTSKVYTIANSYRKNGKIERKLFSIDEYETEYELFDSWMTWVRKVDPSLIIGHNLYGFDFPYLNFCIERSGLSFDIGRDGSAIKFDNYDSKFRKDGSQEYEYRNINIFGREIVDTFFLSIKYDIKRDFESYSLKSIIRQLGMEKTDRTFIDASKISELWKDLDTREKIKQYNIEDADDALKLFDLMAPAYFYWGQSVPMSFQQIINKATGSQVNLMMVRSYLQDYNSIAKASNTSYIEGGISFAVPQIYKNLLKVDLKSAYPSQILRFELYDKYKDPKKHLYYLTKYFTEQRLKNKELSKSTGKVYYNDIEQSQKVAINSIFGFLGAPGLNYNSIELAQKITEETRKVIDMALLWASGKDRNYWLDLFKRKTE